MNFKKILSIPDIAVLFVLSVLVVLAESAHAADSNNILTDSRDGQTYRVVKIGNDTWMAQNLNFETANSWCYGNDTSNCKKYGRLYDWAAAMSACPAGWRLPNCEDWNNLVQTAGGNDAAGRKLKSQTGWNWNNHSGGSANSNGTDEFGFSALPGGGRQLNGRFGYAGFYGGFWSATETAKRGVSGNIAWDRNMGGDGDYVNEFGAPKNAGTSVRCIQGVQETPLTTCFSSDNLAASETAENLLIDPGFEGGGKSWKLRGAVVSNVARSGKAGVTIHNEKTRWSTAEQIIEVPEGAALVTLGGWIKTENVVQGREVWENARISIEFLDKNEKLVGGHQILAGEAVGTTDWTYYSREYRIPAVTPSKTIKVQAALANATGTAHFDDITLTIKNSKGEFLKHDTPPGIMDEGEWYTLNTRNSSTGSHYVDWSSSLLDAPAGKHGFLTVKDGEFVFENGQKIRFWGTNITAENCFVSDAQIDSTVKRLARMGVNMIRMHHLDAAWSRPNIFGNNRVGGTRAFSETSMRQLDYFIYRAKQKGIYIFMDLLVHRDFTKADGIKNPPPDLGAKQVGFFSEKIIDLQKEFNENLLNHVNRFTGVAYKDEPAIALSGIINESTIFGAFSGDILTPHYREELTKLWEKSEFSASAAESSDNDLTENANNSDDANAIKKLVAFGIDWGNNRPKLRLGPVRDGDVHESIKFLSGIETAYFKNMEEHLRKVGARIPLAGSNMPLLILAMLRNNSVLDFTMSNIYWDHPQVHNINDDWSKILEAPIHNRSQLRDPKASFIQNKSYYRVDGKPFVITEWNHCYPNEHLLEGVPLMAAYGALQGWNGVLQFDFNGHSQDNDALGVGRLRSYAHAVQPEHVAQWVMAAPLFIRGDVLAAPGLIVESISAQQYENLPNYSDMLERNYHLPFITKVAKTFHNESNGDIEYYAKYYSADSGIIRSETDELLLNSQQGYMRIETARIQGKSGFIGGVPLDFPLFSGEISNRHASIYAVSADGADLTSSKRFYLVVNGPAKMKGQVYDPTTRTYLENTGEDEVLVQVVNGQITFKNIGGKRVRVFPLEINGKRGKPVKLNKVKGTAGALDLGKGRTLVYEVVVR